MELPESERSGLTVIELEGPRLDAAAAPAFKAALREIIDRGDTRIVIDFSRVQFMDSSGLGALVGCLKYLGARGTLEIARPSSAVMKVFELTRMTKVFKIRDVSDG